MGHPIFVGQPGGEKVAEGGDGGRGSDRAVGGSDRDLGPGFAEVFGKKLAGFFGSDEEEAGRGAIGLVSLVRELR